MTELFVLRAREMNETAAAWRWTLERDDGFVLDRDVTLDPKSWHYQAFLGLHGYLSGLGGDHDDRSVAQLVGELGAWARQTVLGPEICDEVVESTVRVQLTADASFLLNAPLELAHDGDGVPLAENRTTFVYEMTGSEPAQSGKRPSPKDPVGERLRILALLSSPQQGTLLQLRRERYALADSIRDAGRRKNVDLRVLQYGVTRETLSETLEEYESWDILHLCSGGGPAGLWIEDATGVPLHLAADELIDALKPMRQRLKLVVLSAHRSAADTAAALRMLGLDKEAGQLERELGGMPDALAGVHPVADLAQRLVRDLDVAVLAMRYPVIDDFVIKWARWLYRSLLRSGQPVDKAVALSTWHVVGEPSRRHSALCVATPAVYGEAAVNLLLAPPASHGLDLYAERMPEFPLEPPRLVGHVEVLADASAALAPESGHAGVLLVGAAGAGKTACAVELARQRRDRFSRLAWWASPDDVTDLGAMRRQVVEALNRQVFSLGVKESLDTPAAFDQFAQRLGALLAEEALLVVLDNVGPLLTKEGKWRDPQLERLIEALTGHGGPSRVLLTSRYRPAETDLSGVLVRDVLPLTPSESVLLCCELPGLRMLLHHQFGDDGTDTAADREIARAVLGAANGSPSLLRSADDLICFARDRDCDDSCAPLAELRRTLVETMAEAAAAPTGSVASMAGILVRNLDGGPMWTALRPALTRVLAGERGKDLLEGLAPPVSEIVTDVLAVDAQALRGLKTQ